MTTTTATASTVLLSNLPADSFEGGESYPVVAQKLVRESDGEVRYIIIGANEDGDSLEQIRDASPDEVVPSFFVLIGRYSMISADLLGDDAVEEFVKDLPSIEVGADDDEE